MIQKHGVSLGIQRTGTQFFLRLAAMGKLTHEDYEMIMPMIESALEGVKDAKMNVLADLTEMEGWELRAAWDDFRLGMKHRQQFEKVAILGNKKWQEYSAKVGKWFVSGEVEYFEDEPAALAWLQES
ncbi:MAG: STAS/SEC14 domain-containing protein [Hydrogenovibrio sp.]|uniref:STAS/SEC14 domain-containing protein n=1 Tax=Hydrogenovibrio sp. TaxID=2065821 RepID=UPI00287013F3|nr:STAS/SEC14 domain-containing protein [Hydrogenovibrio sp.]MDR9499790.1 STAS/SEC14 domain-containing protein [Hydrogenovibrio sp.]